MSLQNAVNFFWLPVGNRPNQETADECINCWDTPGYDLNCGGHVEPCRFCTDSFTGKRPSKK